MPRVQFTSALKRFEPNLKVIEVSGSTVKDVIKEVDKEFPGLSDYLVEESGSLREHVNIFVGENLIHDKVGLSDNVQPDDEVFIMQALSGG